MPRTAPDVVSAARPGDPPMVDLAKRRVAFLFLGETLLIPHLYPIVEALVGCAPGLGIDLWVSTSVHERLLGGWVSTLAAPNLRIRRAPGFRIVADDGEGRNPPLPAKLPMLARLAPRLARADAVVCAEQTSLWLPRLVPLRTHFVNLLHGAGTMMNRRDRRRRAAWLTLVAAEREREALAEHGVDPERVAAVGYVKAAFRQRSATTIRFRDSLPIVLYTPHWQRHRSSWWTWGPEVLSRIVAAGRYNLIFAPHQRLVETAPEVRDYADALAGRADVLCDLGSFRGVDGSYTAAADVYLGDTSSQVIEFLIRPRPCVFLDPEGVRWQHDPAYAMWTGGEVVTNLGDLLPALDRAPLDHSRYVHNQASLAEAQLGDVGGAAPRRAAMAILEALRR